MLDKLLDYQREICNLQYTINLLRWELKVAAPKKSVDNLIQLITGYEDKLFILQTSNEYGNLLLDTINSDEFKKIDEAEQRYIHNLLRHFQENKNIPETFFSEYTSLKAKANTVWKEAKEKQDYELFKPYLSKIIKMTKEYYKFLNKDATNLYDVMLNDYEMGMTSDIIDRLFNELKEALIPLIKEVANNDAVGYKGNYTEKELLDCATYLLDYIGFDIDRGLLDIYPHGFTEKMNSNDIRIAFSHDNNPVDFVTTIIHEGGHGIFEQNINKNLSRYENTTIDDLYALHESQSRFYENILGRNINFWIPIYDEVSKKLKLNIPLEEFSKALNTVKLSKIRVEADEVTYCLHIIIRYEIERDLFNGSLNVDDIPDVWNKKMKEYLNVDIENNSEGLMQDIHWSEGSFGYFPSYLLGTIYDGMFLEAIEENLGSIDELLKNGKVKEITKFLTENIYQFGGAYTSQEIIQKVSGKELSVKPIINYFYKKYKK